MKALLLAASALLVSGCSVTVGDVSRLDGEWPIRPRSPEPERAVFQEITCGDDGSLVLKSRHDGRHTLVAKGKQATLETKRSLKGAAVRGDHVYTLDGTGVTRHRVEGWWSRSLSRGLKVAEVGGLTELCLLDGKDVALVRPDSVLVAQAGQEPREFWRGEALAIAWDSEREAIWIASRAPLAVIDCVRLSDRKVLFRVPLPVELESPSLRIVLNARHGAIYAHDRHIESALLISPDVGASASLGALGSRAYRPSAAPPEQDPPLIVPLGALRNERLSVRTGKHFGRVVPHGSGFLIVDTRPTSHGPSLWTLRGFGAVDRPPTLQRITAPEHWPRAVQGIGWDEDGATLVAGDDLYRVEVDGGFSPSTESSAGDTFRRSVNVALNLPVAALEVVAGVAVNSWVSVWMVPLGALGMLVDPDPDWLQTLLAPLWYPLAKTFNVDPFN